MIKKCLTIFLCLGLLVCLLHMTGCISNTPQQMQTETEAQTTILFLSGQDLIHRIIYSFLPDTDQPDSTLLLNELKGSDSSAALAWKQILTYWKEVNEPGFVNSPIVTSTSKTTNPATETKTADPAVEPETPTEAETIPSPATEYPLPDDLPQDNTLVIEVLGFALMKDGSMREELIHRLEAALLCAEQYPNAYVLVTGGGTAADAPEATEADAMAAWLTEHGLNADRLIIENRSKTTCENAVFSYEILRKDYPQIDTMAIVTSDYHIPLGCLLFQSWFFLNSEDSSPSVSLAAHACCLSGAYTFTLEEQAYWLENLTTYCK